MTTSTEVAALGPALVERIGKPKYQLWFGDKTDFRWDGERLIVAVQSRFHQDWIQKLFNKDITEVADKVLGKSAPVQFVIDAEFFHTHAPKPAEPTASGDASAGSSSVAADAGLASKGGTQRRGRGDRLTAGRRWHTLEEFQVGTCNRLAHAAMINLLADPDNVPSPVTLYGPAGVGKTHLLEGVYTELRRHLGDGVIFVAAEDFTNRCLQAMHAKQMATFRREFRGATALLMDDFHFLAGKAATQEEFLHTFEALYRAGRPIVLTCSCHPRLLADLPPELADRLLGGAMWPLDPLDKATRHTLLLAKSERLDCPLPAEAIEFLAENLYGNVRELEGALHTIRHFSQVHGRPITLGLVREATSNLLRFTLRVIQLKDVERVVCELLGLDAKALRSKTRAHGVSHPRMIAMYLARRHAGASYAEIGRFFGGRNHTTALAAETKVKLWLEEDESLFINDRRWRVRELVETVERELLQ